jgi:hypothetical protein
MLQQTEVPFPKVTKARNATVPVRGVFATILTYVNSLFSEKIIYNKGTGQVLPLKFGNRQNISCVLK